MEVGEGLLRAGEGAEAVAAGPRGGDAGEVALEHVEDGPDRLECEDPVAAGGGSGGGGGGVGRAGGAGGGFPSEEAVAVEGEEADVCADAAKGRQMGWWRRGEVGRVCGCSLEDVACAGLYGDSVLEI